MKLLLPLLTLSSPAFALDLGDVAHVDRSAVRCVESGIPREKCHPHFYIDCLEQLDPVSSIDGDVAGFPNPQGSVGSCDNLAREMDRLGNPVPLVVTEVTKTALPGGKVRETVTFSLGNAGAFRATKVR